MKARNSKDYNQNWIQTAVSILGLVFVVLTSLGVITPEQSAEGLPVATSVVTAVGTVIGGIVMLIGIFFKPDEPV